VYRLALFLSLVLLLPLRSEASEPAPSREEALRYLILAQIPETLTANRDAYARRMGEGDPRREKAIKALWEKEIGWEVLEEPLIAIVIENFDAFELAEVNLFLERPVGKRWAEQAIAISRAMGTIVVCKLHGEEIEFEPTEYEASRELAEQYLKLADYRGQFDASIQATAASLANGDPNEEVVIASKLDALLGWESLKEPLTRIIMRSFTDGQLTAIITFLGTEPGEALIRNALKMSRVIGEIVAEKTKEGLSELPEPTVETG